MLHVPSRDRPGMLASSSAAGVAAALATVTIWAFWIVGTRHAVATDLEPSALGLLRFGVPALVFAPVWIRLGLFPKGISPRVLLGLMGSGAPFFVIVAAGMRYAPAADAGPLLPGTMPLFVAILSVALLGERLSRARTLGFALVAAGIVAVAAGGLSNIGGGAWRGHALFIAGAFMWAVYTLAFKRSGLSAVEGTALIAVWSTLLLLPVGAPSLAGAIADGRSHEVVAQAVLQGGLSGIIAVVLYGISIRSLGASRAAAFVALVPCGAALLAIPLLGEWPGILASAGIAAATIGVALGSGAFDRAKS
jgi:drug/metabolite transporter (DMT)-like permease